MNCREWEERLALYLGADLPPGGAIEVERHLADCPGCQLFHSGLKEAQELLRNLHREPIAPAQFAAVRVRVLSELERERRPAGQTKVLGGLSALVRQTIIFRGVSALRRPGWVLGLTAVAATLVVALLVAPWVRPIRSASPGASAALPPAGSPASPAVMPPVQSEMPPALPPVQASDQRPTEARQAVHKRPAWSNPRSGEQVLIKMVSDNPDVVIYWIADTRGD